MKQRKPSTLANYQVILGKGDEIQFRLDKGEDNWIDSKVLGRCQKGKRKGEWFTCEVNKRKKVYNLSPGTFIWRKVEDDVENAENKVNFAGSDDNSIIN